MDVVKEDIQRVDGTEEDTRDRVQWMIHCCKTQKGAAERRRRILNSKKKGCGLCNVKGKKTTHNISEKKCVIV